VIRRRSHRSFKHARQWINSIEQHLPCALLDTALDLISPVELPDALAPILRELPETGSRICREPGLAASVPVGV
jgi:hypothetical protein